VRRVSIYPFLLINIIQESFNERLKAFSNPKSTNLYVSNLPRDMTEAASQKIYSLSFHYANLLGIGIELYLFRL
jgi:hypothetical protein